MNLAKNLPCLFLMFFLGFIPSISAAEVLYKNKPAWWDDIKINVIPGKNYTDSYYKTMAGLDYGGEKIENWAILGPFDNNKDKPFEKTYGPDKTLSYNKKEIFTGLKGKKIKWTPWRKGTKCPVDEHQRISKSVFFFYSVYKAPKAGKYTVVFTSDDGAEVWVNKKKVFKDHPPRGMNYIDPNHFEVDLNAGKNEILVKLENRGNSWGLNMIISPYNYEQVRIKAQIMLFNKVAKLNPGQKRTTCEKASWYFLQNDDFPNYIFWFNHQAMKVYEPKTFTAGRMNELSHAINVNKKVKPYVVKYYKDIFNNTKITEKYRLRFIDFIIKDYLERNDTPGLEKFIDIHKAHLKTLMPKKLLEAQIGIQIKKGDHEKASKLVDELKAISNESELRHYNYYLFPIVTSMKSSTIQIPVDWDEKSIQVETNKLIDIKKPATYRFIRKTLSKKANQVKMTDDSELFSGALPVYKKIFAPLSKVYSADLKSYLSLMKNAGEMDSISILQKEAQLSLQPVKVPPYKGPALWQNLKDIQLPKGKAKPFPFLDMTLGTPELAAELDYVSNTLQKRTPAFLNSSNGLEIFQNYHSVVGMKNNQLKWEYIVPSSTPETLTERHAYTKILFGRLNPLILNGKVFVRLFKNGKMTLCCLDAASGKLLWNLNNPKIETCSDVVIWRDRLILVGKENDAPARYYLLEIKQENGALVRQIFLYSADMSFKFTGSTRFQADLFLPVPTIVGNDAFITANNGVILSFNILTSSFNWVKKYKKTPFAQDTVSHLLIGRNSSPPIVSVGNVLYQPINAASLLLLNLQTGQTVKDLGIDWKEVVPCVKEKVIIIFGKERQAAFYSLKNLKKLSLLPGNAYRFVQRLSDGVILQSQNKLVLYDGQGKLVKSMDLPGNIRALYADKTSLFAYNTKDGRRPGLIEKFLLKKPNKVIAVTSDKSTTGLLEFSFKSFGNDHYILSRDKIISLNPDGTLKWSRSIPESNKNRMYQQGKHLYVFSYLSALCLDKETGKTLNSYPEYGMRLKELGAEIVSAEGCAFTHDIRWDAEVVWMTPQKNNLLGKYKKDVTIAAFQKGTLVAGWKQWKKEIGFYRKDPQKGTYSTITSTFKLSPKVSPFRVERFGNFVVFTNLDYLVKVNPDKTVNQIKLAKGKKGKLSGWHFSRDKVFINQDFCAFRSYYDLISIVDFKKGKDLGAIPKFDRALTFINGKFYGLSGYKMICFDPVSEKVIWQTPSEMVEKTVGKLRFVNIFKLNDKVAFYFNYYYEWESQQADGALFLFSEDNPKPEIFYFPGAEPHSEFLDVGKAVLISLPKAKKVIRLSKQEFDSLKSKSPSVFTIKNKPIKYTIDGYPDEWELKKFQTIGKNSFDARVADKHLLLGIEIKDPELIKKMGKSGLDARYSFKAAPGGVASLKFQPWLKPEKTFFNGLETPLKSSAKLETEIDYSVKPDGSSCFIELKLPLKKIMHYPDYHHKKIKTLKWRGDIAFELFFQDKSGIQHAILSGQDIPAFYPRVSFPGEKWLKW